MITDQRQLQKLFWLSWMVYFITYIGRVNYTATMVEIGTSGGYTTSQLGSVVTALFITYGAGQLVSGVLADRMSPKGLIVMGLVGSGLCNLMMGMATSFSHMVIIWLLNGGCMALIWAPILRLFGMYMPKAQLQRSCFHIQTSVAIGTFCTYVLCGSIVTVWKWQGVFYVASGLLLGVAVIAWYGYSQIEKYAEVHGVQKGEAVQCKPLDENKKRLDKKLLTTSGLNRLLVCILMMGFLKDGMMTWIPQYMVDTFEMSNTFSIYLAACLPLVNMVGIYGSKWLYQVTGEDDLKASNLLYGISLVSLLGLVWMGDQYMLVALCCFGVVSSCMLGVNTLLVSVVPTYFASYGKTATIGGLTNSVTYLGSALCGYGVGILLEKVGWQYTSWLLIGCCILAIFMGNRATKKWHAFKKITLPSQ
ncbi:MAG: MFS transporter [Cellulosilyticaceae bacterium]